MQRVTALLLMLVPLAAFAAKQPTLSEWDYKRLMQASKSIEAGQLVRAYKQLSEAKTEVGNDYARALVEHNLGLVELQRERYSQAVDHLTRAYQYAQLPDDQQANLTHTLAQLHCMEEKWRVCIDYLKQWMSHVPDKVKGTDHLLLAQAYSQLEQWKLVIAPIATAIASRQPAPEDWYQLKVAAHVRLKQWQAAIEEQKRMMHHYGDKSRNWRQLVSLHSQSNDTKLALAAQRIGFERGLLREAKDYRLLAQMQLQAGMPFYAGQVMEQGIERGILKQTEKNLRILSHCWIQARESRKAVGVLQQLNKLSPDALSMTQLAQMQIDLQDWQAARITLKRALRLGKGKQGRLQLLLGVVDTKLQRFESARRALLAAAGDKQFKSSAERLAEVPAAN